MASQACIMTHTVTDPPRGAAGTGGCCVSVCARMRPKVCLLQVTVCMSVHSVETIANKYHANKPTSTVLPWTMCQILTVTNAWIIDRRWKTV